MKTSWKALTVCSLLAVALSVTGGVRAWADDEDEQEIEGVLTVDPALDAITINGTVLQVGAGTEIELNDRHVTLEALASFVSENPGTEGEAEYVLISGVAVATEVEVGDDEDEDGDELEVTGTLLDFQGNSLTIQPAGGPAVTVAVNGQTEIEIEDADLTTGQFLSLLPGLRGLILTVEYDPTTGVAHEVEADCDVVVVSAEVVSASRRSLKVRGVRTLAHGGRHASARYQLLPGTLVIKASTLVKARSLKRGDQVQVTYFVSRGRRVAPSVEVTGAP